MAHIMRGETIPSTARSLGKTSLTDEQTMVLRRYSSSFKDMFCQLEYMRELKMFEHTDWQLSLLLVRLVDEMDLVGVDGLWFPFVAIVLNADFGGYRVEGITG